MAEQLRKFFERNSKYRFKAQIKKNIHTPRWIKTKNTDEIEEFIKIHNKGVLIKKINSEGGEGIFLIKRRKHVKELLKINNICINDIIAEELIYPLPKVYNYQFIIYKNKLFFLGSSQIKYTLDFSNGIGSFSHVKNKSSSKSLCKLKKISCEVASRYMALGYEGVIGIDLYDNGSQYGAFEANLRVNFSTSAHFAVRNNIISMQAKWSLVNTLYDINTLKDKMQISKKNNYFYSKETGCGVLVLSKSIECLQVLDIINPNKKINRGRTPRPICSNKL